MRALIVGGTGFVGSHVIEAFVGGGHEVRSFARSHPGPDALPDVEYITGDLSQPVAVARALEGCDAAVYAATATTPGTASRDPVRDATANLSHGLIFLQAAADADLRRLILVSSGGTVYGTAASLPVDELHPTEPRSVYGATRLALEKYFGTFAHTGVARVAVLRAANAYGERQRPDRDQGAPAAFLAALLREEPVEIWGDGSVIRDYVYAGDLAQACRAAAELRSEPDLLVVNIGSGEGLSLLELLDLCARVTGRTPTVRFRHGRAFDVPAVELDRRRAQALLGWRPTMRIEDGLARQAQWLEGHIFGMPQVIVPADAQGDG